MPTSNQKISFKFLIGGYGELEIQMESAKIALIPQVRSLLVMQIS